MLRGEIKPSRSGGEMYIVGISVAKERQLARSHMGVCPQFDAMDLLTVREHLQFYAKVRAVVDVDTSVDALIKAVGLLRFADRMVEKLSGGNKRKLSLAIALIGSP
jgi:ATP-binding cassette subfamily A (ABC1) protein 3